MGSILSKEVKAELKKGSENGQNICGSSANLIGVVESFFIPFWVHLASTLGAKAERRHDEGTTKARRVRV